MNIYTFDWPLLFIYYLNGAEVKNLFYLTNRIHYVVEKTESRIYIVIVQHKTAVFGVWKWFSGWMDGDGKGKWGAVNAGCKEQGRLELVA